MSKRPILACAGVLLLLAPGAAADDSTKQPTADDIAKAEKAVKEQLEKHKATHGQVTHITDRALGKAFSGRLFFGVLFRQYPIAREVPAPLKASNVYAVGRDGKPQLITDGKELETFFRANTSAKDFDPMENAARAWLRLSSELKQDGFYKFEIQQKSIVAELKKRGGGAAEGRVVVMQGGNGEIAAKLTFDEDGKVAKVAEDSKIRPGPRPICQATKLLDGDPVVRRMAEQDLLIMGRFALPYLAEQRARAAPDLRRAIDRLRQRIVDEDR